MTTHLVLGGTRSGKSAHAEALVSAADDVVCIVTGRAGDAEMDERIAAHRQRRPESWVVRETVELDAELNRAASTSTVVIDDLEGWLTARMTAFALWSDADVEALGAAGRASVEEIVAEAAGWWESANRRSGETVVVAGQPGVGITPTGASMRRYVDLHGAVLERLSANADHVSLMVAGRAVPLQPPAVPAGAAMLLQPPAVTAGRTTTSSRDAPDDSHFLREHGDRQVPDGTIDLAVNVLDGPPAWLRDRLAGCLDDLSGYPDDDRAREALAARHGRRADEIVALAGAADGMWLLPRVLRPRLAACIHPGFTEPEAALREAGVPIVRVQRDPIDWRLDPADVPGDADFVVLGCPDNPTGVVDPEATIAALCRPGRTVVVDEAFTEFLPDAAGVAGRGDLPGLVVLRSYTKLWGLAGLRVGYLVAEAPLARRLGAIRQPWAVGRLALEALTALCDAEDERRQRADAVDSARRHLLAGVRAIPDVTAWDAAANFVLLRTRLPDLRERLLADGFATRRCDNFPGLDSSYLRVAVRTPEVSDRLVHALARHLTPRPAI